MNSPRYDHAAFNLGADQPLNRVPTVPLGNESRRSFAQTLGVEIEVDSTGTGDAD